MTGIPPQIRSEADRSLYTHYSRARCFWLLLIAFPLSGILLWDLPQRWGFSTGDPDAVFGLYSRTVRRAEDRFKQRHGRYGSLEELVGDRLLPQAYLSPKPYPSHEEFMFDFVLAPDGSDYRLGFSAPGVVMFDGFGIGDY
jgi:hypothetical protein